MGVGVAVGPGVGAVVGVAVGIGVAVADATGIGVGGALGTSLDGADGLVDALADAGGSAPRTARGVPPSPPASAMRIAVISAATISVGCVLCGLRRMSSCGGMGPFGTIGRQG